MGGISVIIHSVFTGFFGKSQVTVIYIEFIMAFITIDITRITHIDIQPSVSVDISKAHPS